MGWENDIKQTLEERRIEPKSSTWERLEANLQDEEKTSYLIYWRIGIAAVFLIGIIVTGLVFNQHNVTSSHLKMVAKVDKTKTLNKTSSDKTNKSANEQKVGEELHPTIFNEAENVRNGEIDARNSLANTTYYSNGKETNQPINSSEEQESQLQTNKMESSKNIANVPIHSTFEEPILNKARNGQQNAKSTDEMDEADILLAKAQRKIKVEIAFKNDINNVLASDLLEGVKYDDTKKTKRFPELIQEGWNYTVTLYNNRNQK